MASIKNLKKEIKTLASELMLECETYKSFHPDINPEKFDKINVQINEKLNSVIYDINHYKKVNSKQNKDYFRKIVNKVKEELIPVLDKLTKIEE